MKQIILPSFPRRRESKQADACSVLVKSIAVAKNTDTQAVETHLDPDLRRDDVLLWGWC